MPSRRSVGNPGTIAGSPLRAQWWNTVIKPCIVLAGSWSDHSEPVSLGINSLRGWREFYLAETLDSEGATTFTDGLNLWMRLSHASCNNVINYLARSICDLWDSESWSTVPGGPSFAADVGCVEFTGAREGTTNVVYDYEQFANVDQAASFINILELMGYSNAAPAGGFEACGFTLLLTSKWCPDEYASTLEESEPPRDTRTPGTDDEVEDEEDDSLATREPDPRSGCPEGFTLRGTVDGTYDCVPIPGYVPPGDGEGFEEEPPSLEVGLGAGVVIRGTAPPPCPDEDLDYDQLQTCTEDSSAPVPEWTTQTSPFLNQRTCTYSVPIETNQQCPEGDLLHSSVLNYVQGAAQKLVEFLNKRATDEDIQILYDYVNDSLPTMSPGGTRTSAYITEKAPNRNLKILFLWPFGLIKALRLRDKTPNQLSDIQENYEFFNLKTDGFFENLDELERYLYIFGKEQVDVWRKQNKKLVVAGTSQEINLSNEHSQIDKLKKAFTDLLISNGYTKSVNGSTTTGTPFEAPDQLLVAEEVQMQYDSSYSLKHAFARERAGDFDEVSLSIALGTALDSPTFLAYLSRLDDILYDLSRSNRMTVIDFVEKYHFPKVTAVDAASVRAPVISQDNCAGGIGGELIQAGNSILDTLMSADELLVDQFSKYVCMTPDQIQERDIRLEDSSEMIKSVLESQLRGAIPTDDPIVQLISKAVNGLSEEENAVVAAWEKLFNKLTLCGLFGVMAKTLEFIANTDVCGISPQKALLTAITSSLKSVNLDEIRRLFDSLPAPIASLVRDRYFASINQFLGNSSFNSTTSFPWDLERANQRQQEQEERGTLLYASDLFTTPPREERVVSIESAYIAGYRHSPFEPQDEEESIAYWDGYVQFDREGDDTTPLTPDVEAGLTPLQSQELMGRTAQTMSVNRQSVNTLVQRLSGDTIKFMTQELVTVLMEALQENMAFSQIIDMLENIPVVGAIIKALPEISKCVVNVNTSDEQELNFSQLQQNLLSKVTEFDICDLPPLKGHKPVALPNIKIILDNLPVRQIWASFINSLIETLKQILISLFLKILLNLLSKAIEVLQGGVCAATKGELDSYFQSALPPGMVEGGNLRDIFREAMCGDGAEISDRDIDAQMASLFSSFAPNLSASQAQSILSGDEDSCSLIDRVKARLTNIQLLNLLEGRASENTLAAVLGIVRNHCTDLSAFLSDEATVASFFMNVGATLPPGFLEELRGTFGEFGVEPELIITTCDIGPEDALDNLRNSLREECGDGITDAQIEEYVDSFQSRLESIVEDMASTLGGGLENGLQDVITSAIDNLLPKDEPGTLIIIEDIISAMFDPLYGFYARDLLQPVQPNNNAGLLNMVLANRNAVGLRGQINNFGAALGFLGGPLFAIVSVLPPPANALAGADALNTLTTNLRLTFFGPPNDAGSWPEDLPVPPPLPSPGPYGLGPTLKPPTVAQSLRGVISDLAPNITIDGNVIQLSLPTEVALESRLPAPPPPALPRYLPGGKIFSMTYNFQTGEFSYVPGAAPGYTLLDESKRLSFTVGTESAILEQYQDLVTELEDYIGVAGSAVSPTTTGAAILIRNSNSASPSWATPAGSATYGALFQSMQSLVSRLRVTTLDTAAKRVGANSEAFNYGEYNLTALADDMVLDPPSEDLVADGYSFVYLNDGSIFIQPPTKGGWLTVKDALVPKNNEEFCCPDKTDLFGIEQLKEYVKEAFKVAPEDPRLSLNPRTVKEPAYGKILSRMNLASIEGNIVATVRAYVIEYFLKGYATFNLYRTRSPDVYSDLLPEYIAQRMKERMADQPIQPGGPVWPPGLPPGLDLGNGNKSEKLNEYWYQFLEQTVQAYSRRIKASTVDVTSEVNSAMTILQNAVDSFKYPNKSDLVEARQALVLAFTTSPAAPVIGPFLPIALANCNLKNYRKKVKVDAIKATENEAMVILKEVIKEELQRVSAIIDDLLPPPTIDDGIRIRNARRVSNAYFDIINNTVTHRMSGGTRKQLFNASNYLQFPGPPADFTVFPLLSEDLGTLAAYENIFADQDRYVLEAYVRVVKTPLGESRFPNIENNAVYSIKYIHGIIQDERDSFGGLPVSRLDSIFESMRYGLRMVFVPSPATVSDSEFSGIFNAMAADDYNPSGLFRHRPISELYPGADENLCAYTIPVLYSSDFEVEYTIDSAYTTQQFHAADMDVEVSRIIQNDGLMIFRWREIVGAMLESSEFNVLFGYSIPTRTILSLLGIYNVEGFLPSFGTEDTWDLTPARPRPFQRWNEKIFPVLKRKLKRMFKDIYNSNDISYRPEPLGSSARQEANKLRLPTIRGISPFDPLEELLTQPVRDRLTYNDPTCFNIEGFPGIPGAAPMYGDPGRPGSIADVVGTTTDEEYLDLLENGVPFSDGVRLDVVPPNVYGEGCPVGYELRYTSLGTPYCAEDPFYDPDDDEETDFFDGSGTRPAGSGGLVGGEGS